MEGVTRSQAILHPLPAAALFLVLTVRQGGEDTARDVLADVPALRRAVGFRVPDDRLEVVVGVGSDAWGRLFSGPRPAGLHPFIPLDGGRHSAPSTPSFTYFDDRDLLGFVDGTENPEDEDAADAALVGDEDPGFAGGSYVIVQKYLHDMSAWHALSVGEQERVIGRTKMEDVELDDDVKPANAHVALNDLPDADDGRAREILRSNMPFGELGKGEFGTYFIGYAGHVEDTELMLENMFLGFPPGNYDRILDFSTAVTGTLFYCPTVDFLEDQPASPSLTGDPAAIDPSPATPDGSLGIGDLGRSTS